MIQPVELKLSVLLVQRKKYLCCECQESVSSEVLVMKPLMQPPPALNGGPPSHYVAFHSVTSGLNGPDLGSDESDIVLLVFIVVDAKTKQVGNTLSASILPHDFLSPLLRRLRNIEKKK